VRPTDPELTRELAQLRASVEELRTLLRPLPDRVSGLAKGADAQRKRVDALSEAQTRAQELLVRLDARLGPPPGPRHRVLADRLRSLLQGLRPAPATTPPPSPTPPAPTVQALDWILSGPRTTPDTRAVLVALFGLDAGERETVVARLLTAIGETAPPLLPVFLTDDSDFTALRRHQARFEYLPLRAAERGQGPPRDWPLYLARRFALICAKWQPLQVVAFGAHAARQLAEWRSSPQLPDTAKDLLVVPPVTGSASVAGLLARADQPSSKKSTAPSSRS
jgi:hypothetical protein